MLKKNQLILVVCIMSVIAHVFAACDIVGGTALGGNPGNGSGSGTASDPYRIYTKAEFMAIDGGPGTNGKYYRLEADLVGANTITEPLGNNSEKSFMGHFDGGGHSINLNITGNYESAGLFATVGPSLAVWGAGNGSVKNLKLTGTVNVSGSNVKYAGAAAGSAIDDVGYNVTFISGIASSVTVTISGPNALYAGGIFGGGDAKEISHCAALNPVVSGDNVNAQYFIYGTFRVGAGLMSGNPTYANNYANSAMTVNGAVPLDYKAHNDRNGADVTLAATEAENWWKTTAGWSSKFGTSDAAPWKWDSNSNRPVLWFE